VFNKVYEEELLKNQLKRDILTLRRMKNFVNITSLSKSASNINDTVI
jgi:hypothetical protein